MDEVRGPWPGTLRQTTRPSSMDKVRGPSPGTLRQTPHRTPPDLASNHRAPRKRPDHGMTSYNRTLEITRCASIETALRTRRLLWAGAPIRMSEGCLSKRIVFESLEGANCVQGDIWAHGIAGDWKVVALEAECGLRLSREWAEVHCRVEERIIRRG